MTDVELFNKHYNFAPYVVRKYFSNLVGNDDVMQEAFISLWKSCKSYDESKGASFTTYACRVIRNDVNMYIYRSNPYGRYSYSKYSQVNNLVLDKGVSVSEACSQVGIKEFLYRQISLQPISIDYASNSEGEEYSDFIPSDEDICSEVESKYNILESSVLSYLETLEPNSYKTKFFKIYTQDILSDNIRCQNDYADLLGISQPQVSRLKKKYSEELYNYLSTKGDI